MKLGTRYVFLSKGMVALVDHYDFAAISQHRWYAHRGTGRRTTWYASRCERRRGVNRRYYLHRVILRRGQAVDHQNGNGLDCRRANLRPTTHSCNARNHPLRVTSTTGYKGVDLHPSGYRARIMAPSKKRLFLGFFEEAVAAAQAYDQAAKRLHGKYARLNFPNP